MKLSSKKKSTKTSKSLPKIEVFTNIHRIKKILVIGCGGTGGYLVPNLARFISQIKPSPELYLADGDVVEEKNLIRQNFVFGDIGKNKAEVLARRYSNAFGMEITAIAKDIEDAGQLIKDFMGEAIIAGCVDNVASRQIINSWFIHHSPFEYSKGKIWIDAGNEERAGQVVCGVASSCNLSCFENLPSVFEVYPDMLKINDKLNSQMSCAERAISAPQNIQTNATAGNLMMNYIQKIISHQQIFSHAVEFNIDNIFSTKLNTPENLSKININRRTPWEKNYYENYK